MMTRMANNWTQRRMRKTAFRRVNLKRNSKSELPTIFTDSILCSNQLNQFDLASLISLSWEVHSLSQKSVMFALIA